MRASHVKRFVVWTKVAEYPRDKDDTRVTVLAGETADGAEHLPMKEANLKRLLFKQRTDFEVVGEVFAHIERAIECMNRAQLAVAAAELHPHGIQNLFNFYMEQEADVTETSEAD